MNSYIATWQSSDVQVYPLLAGARYGILFIRQACRAPASCLSTMSAIHSDIAAVRLPSCPNVQRFHDPQVTPAPFQVPQRTAELFRCMTGIMLLTYDILTYVQKTISTDRRAILKRREYLSNLTIRQSLREQRTERPGNAEQGCRPPLLSAPQVAPQDTCTIQPPLPGQP